MSEPEPADVDDEIIATISDYLDGALEAGKRDEVAAKIGQDPAWKKAHDEMLETRKFLSGMQKKRAPGSFAADVTGTINQRSAGRFFARRTFGDRVPFGALLVVAVLALAVIGYVMWTSETGSLKVQRDRTAPPRGSAEIVPRP